MLYIHQRLHIGINKVIIDIDKGMNINEKKVVNKYLEISEEAGKEGGLTCFMCLCRYIRVYTLPNTCICLYFLFICEDCCEGR